MPFPAARASSFLTADTLTGAEAEQLSLGTSVEGSSLVLTAGAAAPEYALYRFNPGCFAQTSLAVNLEPGTTAVWVGVANFTADRWEFSGPFAASPTLPLGDPKYLAAWGDIWVAVIADRGESGTVSSLQITPGVVETGWDSRVLEGTEWAAFDCPLAVINGKPGSGV